MHGSLNTSKTQQAAGGSSLAYDTSQTRDVMLRFHMDMIIDRFPCNAARPTREGSLFEPRTRRRFCARKASRYWVRFVNFMCAFDAFTLLSLLYPGEPDRPQELSTFIGMCVMLRERRSRHVEIICDSYRANMLRNLSPRHSESNPQFHGLSMVARRYVSARPTLPFHLIWKSHI